MNTIQLKGAAGAKAKALEPYLGEYITIYLNGETFAVGFLESLDRIKAKIRCKESGEEFFVRYSNMSEVTIRSRGNWQSKSKNSSEAKTERLQVRCTLEQRIEIEKAAGLAEQTLSDFVLKAALDFGKATALWCG